MFSQTQPDPARVTSVLPVEKSWQVLVVDDDPEVHSVTRLALEGDEFDGKQVKLLSAYSAAEARAILSQNPDIALVLLDVVMETEHAGLDLVRYIREEQHNVAVRIVVRTGQPGQAPEWQVVAQYDIDGYITKTEITFHRLHTLVITALRTNHLLRRLEARQNALTQSREELERFASVAAHDLQTPLRNILSLGQLLTRRIKGQLDEESKNLLRMLTDNAGALRQMVNDVLDYARFTNECAKYQPVMLQDIVQQSCLLLNQVIEERGAIIEYRDLPVIEGDAPQLECLMRNLIENGIKFQPGLAPRVTVNARPVAHDWEISVQDHGIGIAGPCREQVFQMFKQLHSIEQYPGSGMGLAICKKIVAMHNGKIEITDTPGGGTTMRVTLPADQQQHGFVLAT